MMNQATIEREVSAVGTGLHSGNLVNMTLKPAAPNTGICFLRTDLAGASVKASMDNVDFSSLQLATTLSAGGVVVQTTEHLMSAAYAYGITNMVVELDGPEVPIMDGSAAPFLVLLEEAGRKRQAVACKVLEVTKPFVFEDGDKRVEIKPADDFRVSYEIDFDHPLIRRQQKTFVVDGARFENQIAPARTFGFLRDVNMLQSMGLIKGGSLDNAVVLDGDRILNGNLRMADEFVSHKILDLVGDFSVSGYRFRGHVKAFKAGHDMHARFMRAFLASDCYRIVTVAEKATVRPALTRPVAASV
ncbi:MAG: UDP-3-O-acyl-N-acetylglucosamine deacetylase [Acidobacteriota bacterium]|nr:UDP-3-O-acyl-N-acetylglucosamine deacetylase [Acidobacteriota bacterium]